MQCVKWYWMDHSHQIHCGKLHVRWYEGARTGKVSLLRCRKYIIFFIPLPPASYAMIFSISLSHGQFWATYVKANSCACKLRVLSQHVTLHSADMCKKEKC